MQNMKRVKGFSLIEMLLVSVIILMVLYGAMSYYQQKAQTTRVDRTAAQMQQILNAAMSYYVMNGKWPLDLQCLQGINPDTSCGNQYLPKLLVSPWGGGDYITASTKTNFYVFTTVTTQSSSTVAGATAGSISGLLPNAYTSTDAGSPGTPPAEGSNCSSGTTCTVVASVNIPGDNLNNAKAVNFAGLYHNGSCIPVPTCPVDPIDPTQSMVPQVFVAPVSVSGKYDSSSNVYPISSFSAYATGGDDLTPPDCMDKSASPTIPGGSCGDVSSPEPNSKKYWRSCLQIVTERGELTNANGSKWGDETSILAFTRCAVNNEPAGSTYLHVYQ